MKLTMLSLVLQALTFKGTIAAECFIQPDNTWPLGQGIMNREIVTNASPETMGDFSYVSSPLPYNALQFYGNSSSFVDVRLSNVNNDFSLYFYINPTVHGGRILHYLSDDQLSIGITEMRLDMETDGRLTYTITGNLINLDNGGADTGSFTVPTNTWSIVIMEIDVSKTNVKITIDDFSNEMSGAVLTTGVAFVSPGVMRIASSHFGDSTSFQGAITCLHQIQAKNLCETSDFVTECSDNWPTTTSTSTSTTTTTPPTTTTTTSPTTTTTTPTTTTTTTPTTSTTTTTTPTTTSTTSTTTPTTTSTVPTTSTTTPTTSSTAITTTAAITTSTTAYVSVLSPAMPVTGALQTGCRQYNLFDASAEYANTSDIITTIFVNDVRACLLECDLHAECMTFSFDDISGRCSAGKLAPNLKISSSSSMFGVM